MLPFPFSASRSTRPRRAAARVPLRGPLDWPLGIWLAIGLALRLGGLAAKPLWSDEFATLAFGLGRGFLDVPLDRPIALATLLDPLRLAAAGGPAAAVDRLLAESTHPPAYFALANLWMRAFPGNGGLVSVWAARSLSVAFGLASIPAAAWLARRVWRSAAGGANEVNGANGANGANGPIDADRAGRAAAAIAAASPFGIYLAQEARHYTLAILLAIASLGCFATVLRSLPGSGDRVVPADRPLSPAGTAGWIAANGLGLATHYFFGLLAIAEGLVLAGLWVRERRIRRDRAAAGETSARSRGWGPWRPVALAALGTAAGGAVWLPFLGGVSDDKLVHWIYDAAPWETLPAAVGRLVAWTAAIAAIFPVEAQPLPVAIAAGAAMLAVLLLAGNLVRVGLQSARFPPAEPDPAIASPAQCRAPWDATAAGRAAFGLGWLWLAIAGTMLAIAAAGMDLTAAARYQFVAFPAAIVLLAGGMAAATAAPRPWANGRTVATVLLASILGGFAVAAGLAFQRPDQPDRVAAAIAASRSRAPVPVLVATVHKTHEQTGELMGIAWELRELDRRDRDRPPLADPVQFLLAHKDGDPEAATAALDRALADLPRPLELWVVNFAAPAEVERQGCLARPDSKTRVPGYVFRRYRCDRPAAP